MTTTTQPISPSDAELAALWQERVRTGTFSHAVQGTGIIRVMGKSGDTPVAFPRIETLAALDSLELDEQWAIRAAEAIFTQARQAKRQVMETQPPTLEGGAGIPTVVRRFDPTAHSLLVTNMITGG